MAPSPYTMVVLPDRFGRDPAAFSVGVASTSAAPCVRRPESHIDGGTRRARPRGLRYRRGVEALGHCTFATAIGRCGIAWSAAGICGVQLPEASAAALEARMRRRFAGVAESAPTEEAQAAIDGVRALLAGEAVDLSFVRLDMDGVPPLYRDVYRLARAIPPGDTRTYGELARALCKPGAARAIGQAMGRNPFAPVVPCHRVVAASSAGGFSAGGGVATKLRLLDIERRGGPGPLPLFDVAAPARGHTPDGHA